MSDHSPPAKPWDPLDIELDEDGAYHHFCIYRDLPPGERSVTEVHRISASDIGIDRMRRWAVEYAWKARANAYDARRAHIRLRAREEAFAAQANHDHYRVLAGFYMTEAGIRRAQQLRRTPEEISARDLPTFVKTGLELLKKGEDEQAARLDLSRLSAEDLDTIERIMAKAGATEDSAQGVEPAGE